MILANASPLATPASDNIRISDSLKADVESGGFKREKESEKEISRLRTRLQCVGSLEFSYSRVIAGSGSWLEVALQVAGQMNAMPPF